MPQSLTCLLYHIIFSTKHREVFIDDELKPHLHAYLGGILHEICGRPVAIGGVEATLKNGQLVVRVLHGDCDAPARITPG